MKNFVSVVVLVFLFVATVSARRGGGGGGRNRGGGRHGRGCDPECTDGKVCRRGECRCPKLTTENSTTNECESICNNGAGCGDNGRCKRNGECHCHRAFEMNGDGECQSKCNNGTGCGDNERCSGRECVCQRGFEMNEEQTECISKCEPACDAESQVCKRERERGSTNYICKCKKDFVMEDEVCILKESEKK